MQDCESAVLAWQLVLPWVADLHDGTLRALLRARPTLLKLCPAALAYIARRQPSPPHIVARVYDGLSSTPFDAAAYGRDVSRTAATIDAFDAYVFALQCTKGCGGTWKPNRLAAFRHPEPLTFKIIKPNGLSVIMMAYKLPRGLDIKRMTELVCGDAPVVPPIVCIRIDDDEDDYEEAAEKADVVSM
jgi:hypothetical protein